MPPERNASPERVNQERVYEEYKMELIFQDGNFKERKILLEKNDLKLQRAVKAWIGVTNSIYSHPGI